MKAIAYVAQRPPRCVSSIVRQVSVAPFLDHLQRFNVCRLCRLPQRESHRRWTPQGKHTTLAAMLLMSYCLLKSLGSEAM